MSTLKFPFGAVATLAISADASDDALTIASNFTIVTTATLTANATIDLTIGSEVQAGAVLFLIGKTNGTETITFGTGIEAPVITGAAGKTVTQGFVYNGTNFYPMGAKIQVD